MQRSKILLLAIGLALAAGGFGLSMQGSDDMKVMGNFTYRIANVVFFAWIIWHFFGDKLGAFFKGRSEKIAGDLADLEQGKAETQEKLAAIEDRIASLDTEREAILEAYRKQGENLEASIVEQANKTAGQIIEQAKVTAQTEVDNAIADLRSQMADEIVAAAEKTLAKKLTPAEQAKLVDKYLTRVVLN